MSAFRQHLASATSAATWRRRLRTGVDILLPPQCLSCRTMVAGDNGLCADCWDAIDFLGPPHCPRCGFPFEFELGEDVLCGACLRRPPVYDRCRAAFRYADDSRRLVLNLKHGDRTYTAPALARMMLPAGRDLFADAEAIVPVPLHRWRLLRRRFNQSALLANELGKLTGLPVQADALRRVRPTPSQGRLSRSARRRNVRGAFRLSERGRTAIASRRVLVIDDVLTTGATVDAVARCLLRGGAAAVDVLTLARVVRAVYD